MIILLSILLRKRFLKLLSHPTSLVSRSEDKQVLTGEWRVWSQSPVRRDPRITEWDQTLPEASCPLLLHLLLPRIPRCTPDPGTTDTWHNQSVISQQQSNSKPVPASFLPQNIPPGHTGTSHLWILYPHHWPWSYLLTIWEETSI